MTQTEKALREALAQAVEWDSHDAEGVPAIWLEAARAALSPPETVGEPVASDVDWLHKFINCTPFGADAPAEDIQRAHRIVDSLVALPSQPAQGEQQAAYPHIIEALSWHRFERDDMTVDELVEVIRHGYVKVRQRTHRQLELQLLAALATARKGETE